MNPILKSRKVWKDMHRNLEMMTLHKLHQVQNTKKLLTELKDQRTKNTSFSILVLAPVTETMIYDSALDLKMAPGQTDIVVCSNRIPDDEYYKLLANLNQKQKEF